MNAAVHWATIGAMVLCGLGMGALFDVYRVSSRRFHLARWLLPAFDLLYWVAATIVVFRVLLANNLGEVRLYVFLGLGIGITGYFGLFSPFVIKLTSGTITVVGRLFRLIWRTFRTLLLNPFLWIVRMLARLLDIAFIVTAAILLWLFRLLLKPLAPLGRWLWAKLLPVRRSARKVQAKFQAVLKRVKEIWELLQKKL
ncbi:spore cortex biosynthesis protein YabQ [Cohnella nanjingensis]|uniref:Spore cortex biosynthesis protein YabQ n=1 Tax=Cohnella nanjingensis TaxID=1387779 RepID=A0A7X0RNF9_9BACL|nr:spore cortex biosynthesis protein YabQ [Cohnella nanjingensis]MBB6669571.1 spore cortex biosynthesis protein YabQ [Cohnella nanjingensis]